MPINGTNTIHAINIVTKTGNKHPSIVIQRTLNYLFLS